MKQIKSHRVRRILALTLALSLLLTACGGGGASAATMHLRRAEGTVGVSDGEGKAVEPRDDLGLYSGYGVDTQTESYAWIDLDEVKLTKLDQDSEIEITKEGKKLEIEVKSGNLFFNVTEPLDDDETLNIRSSTMLVGIRGTCGWVTQDAAALLEGSVEVTAGEQTVTVNAGEMAVLTDGALEVKPFSSASVPAFVKAELEDDDTLAEAVKAASGINIAGHSPSDYVGFRQLERQYDILFAEEIDFEMDGSPELFVIYDMSGDRVRLDFQVLRIAQDGSGLLFNNNVLGGVNDEDRKEIGEISLVESEGRPYILVYHYITYSDAVGTTVKESYRYMGSTAQNDGDYSFWTWVDDIDCEHYEGSNGYTSSRYSVSNSADQITAGEYEAVIQKYTEVRVLVSVD